MLENGLEICPCPRVKCKRHGQCNECIDHHKTKKHPSYCKRETKAKPDKAEK